MVSGCNFVQLPSLRRGEPLFSASERLTALYEGGASRKLDSRILREIFNRTFTRRLCRADHAATLKRMTQKLNIVVLSSLYFTQNVALRMYNMLEHPVSVNLGQRASR